MVLLLIMPFYVSTSQLPDKPAAVQGLDRQRSAIYILEEAQKNLISRIEKFKNAIRSADAIVIFISATWCPPCQTMKPIIYALEDELTNTHLFLHLDFNKDADIISAFNEVFTDYGIQGIPAYIFVKDGKIVHMGSGVLSKEEFMQKLDTLFGPLVIVPECP
jgi:thioredoxin 1